MDNVIFDFAISTILTTLRLAVKNEARKAQLKAVMLKVAATIFAIWPNDPDFNTETPAFKAKVKKEQQSLNLKTS